MSILKPATEVAKNHNPSYCSDQLGNGHEIIAFPYPFAITQISKMRCRHYVSFAAKGN
jgi:hypothetical protein